MSGALLHGTEVLADASQAQERYLLAARRACRGCPPWLLSCCPRPLPGVRRARYVAGSRAATQPRTEGDYLIPATVHALAVAPAHRADTLTAPSLTTVAAMLSVVTQTGFV